MSTFIDAAGDPEGDHVAWLRTGCPVGVAKEIMSCGIFPATEPGDVNQLESWRHVDEEPSINCKSVDEAVELSGAEVDRLIVKLYAVKYVRELGKTSSMPWEKCCGNWCALSKLARTEP